MRRERVGGGREPVGALVDRIESHIVWILVVLREWKKRHPDKKKPRRRTIPMRMNRKATPKMPPKMLTGSIFGDNI